MAVEKMPASYSLVEVLGRVLDRGIVIERREVLLALFYIEGLVLEERAAIISVDTYLKYAEAVGLLPLEETRHVTEYASRDRPRAEIP
ncbi:MAG: gas vesicle synthesis protein GvpA [Anaerolineae bacterium]|nr:gas vesicle synthesis protein GvpA [Anaerolineae bacterium]